MVHFVFLHFYTLSPLKRKITKHKPKQLVLNVVFKNSTFQAIIKFDVTAANKWQHSNDTSKKTANRRFFQQVEGI